MSDGPAEVARHGAVYDGVERGIEVPQQQHVGADVADGVGGVLRVEQEDDDVVRQPADGENEGQEEEYPGYAASFLYEPGALE